MGADMIVTILALKKGDEPDFAAGKEFVRNLELNDERVSTMLNQGFFYDDEFTDDDGNPNVEKMRESMLTDIDDLHGCLYGRGVSVVTVRDLQLFITGGMSWGDDTEEGTIFSKIECVDGLLKVMNFVPDWFQEEVVVTPDEEAAAIASIQKVGS